MRTIASREAKRDKKITAVHASCSNDFTADDFV